MDIEKARKVNGLVKMRDDAEKEYNMIDSIFNSKTEYLSITIHTNKEDVTVKANQGCLFNIVNELRRSLHYLLCLKNQEIEDL